MMRTTLFSGCGCAMVTPFKEDGGLDEAALSNHTEELIEGGVSALIVCGTTGEPPALEEEEKDQILKIVIRKAQGRVPVIMGVGGNNTAHVIKNAQVAREHGADGVLAVTPYYNKTSPRGLENHFRSVLDASPLPVILYNVPARCGYSLEVETLQNLLPHPNLAGLKESTSDLRRICRLRDVMKDACPLYAGDDEATLPFLFLGAQGVISVAANAYPKEMSSLCKAGIEGNQREALALHDQLFSFFEALSQDINPIPIKAAMEYLQKMSGTLRMPLLEMEEEKKKKLYSALERARHGGEN